MYLFVGDFTIVVLRNCGIAELPNRGTVESQPAVRGAELLNPSQPAGWPADRRGAIAGTVLILTISKLLIISKLKKALIMKTIKNNQFLQFNQLKYSQLSSKKHKKRCVIAAL